MEEEQIIMRESPADNETYFSEPYTDEFGSFISIYKPLKTTGGIPVVIGVDLEISDVNTLRRSSVLGTLLSLIIGIGISVLISLIFAGTITKPISELDDELRQLAEADLTIRIKSKSKNEIGQFANSFNQFVAKLQDLISGITYAIEETDHIKTNLIGSTDQTSLEIDTINSNLKGMKEQFLILEKKSK